MRGSVWEGHMVEHDRYTYGTFWMILSRSSHDFSIPTIVSEWNTSTENNSTTSSLLHTRNNLFLHQFCTITYKCNSRASEGTTNTFMKTLTSWFVQHPSEENCISKNHSTTHAYRCFFTYDSLDLSSLPPAAVTVLSIQPRRVAFLVLLCRGLMR